MHVVNFILNLIELALISSVKFYFCHNYEANGTNIIVCFYDISFHTNNC